MKRLERLEKAATALYRSFTTILSALQVMTSDVEHAVLNTALRRWLVFIVPALGRRGRFQRSRYGDCR